MASSKILSKVNKINTALNISLTDWQIDLIFYPKKKIEIPSNKIYEKELALKIKQILDVKSKYIWKLGEPFSLNQIEKLRLNGYSILWNGDDLFRGKYFLLGWKKLYKALQKTGLKLAEVKWFKKDF